jgi:DNA replication protein DnaC
VPAQIVYDRTKTVVRRHVGRGQATPLHPEAVAFASHYDFAIWLAAPYRAQTKGRVERQVEIVRSHVLDGRSFASLAELDAAFAAWLPHRRSQVHRTHGEVIAARADRDRAALSPLPDQPYVVCDRHTRRVGKDALISFAASHYSVPWRKVRPGSRVELRVTPAEVAIWSLGPSQQLLATHPAPPDAAAGWSTRATGTAFPTGPRVSRCRHAPQTASSPHLLPPSLASSSCPGSVAGPAPRRPGSWSPSDALPSMTSWWRWRRERAGRHPHPRARRTAAARPPGRGPGRPGRPGRTADHGLPGLPRPDPGRRGRRPRGPPLPQRLKLSGLPHHKSLDSFDFAFQPDLDARKVRDLAALGFVEHKANVAFLGPPGVGKTMLAAGLAIAACQAGSSVYFTTLDDLVRNLKDAEASGRFAKKLQTYLKPAVLVVDEVGYLPLARPDANMVFQLVARRYERGSILLTSNKAFSEWGQVFGDDVLASAILDRLLHHCEVISINGPSYRLKDRL